MNDPLRLLSQPVHSGPISARFDALAHQPPLDLVTNVNVVPYIGDRWLVIRLSDGAYEIPGGTLEPGEHYLDAAKRELMEEAGAELWSFHVIGAWACHSSAPAPYRPHLPHPDFYRLVGSGEVNVVSAPTNPPDAENVAEVLLLPLGEVVERFQTAGRADIAALYALAAALKTSGFANP